ncbi:1-(5-phosphoribosyl)-5-amino-4-imidazole-carboxylate carboxylase [Modestobacter roseus]|uniref:PurE domain-containing protein n=1 Tax=Modestobacter roseus TaxID=1181884 RepID=A0A562IPD6_9ACTN|nr:1-(5-phosphoribosyl)-5-amino-4-imidazole-carboxylate carboxylase [Modestobacter roseus]TWH72889.1 hypothetical protein JD78_01412 [Modestobacter roseus]
MSDPGYVDLGFARVDTDRLARTGDPEVVYAAGKTADEVVAIVATLRGAAPERPALVTRATTDTVSALADRWPDLLVERSTVAVGPLPAPAGRVAVVSAGTSDEPVATEAAMTLRVHGAGVVRVTDVGVAGLHRVLATRPVLDEADVVVVVAGMEGALPSVVGAARSCALRCSASC